MMKIKSYSFVINLAVLMMFPVLSATQEKKEKINLVTTETSLGKIPAGAILSSLVVSPDNRNVAFGARHEGKRIYVVINGPTSSQ